MQHSPPLAVAAGWLFLRWGLRRARLAAGPTKTITDHELSGRVRCGAPIEIQNSSRGDACSVRLGDQDELRGVTPSYYRRRQ
jgi:hypothetical protein